MKINPHAVKAQSGQTGGNFALQHFSCQREAHKDFTLANMYIVAIAWLYVVLLMSLTETNPVAGVMTFVFYGLLPLALLLWLIGTPFRRRRLGRKAETVDEEVRPVDREDSQAD